jgi:hypothetical protein
MEDQLLIVVLCEAEDTCGLWLAIEIAQRGFKVDVIMPDELVVGSRFSLNITKDYNVASIQLADGRVIEGENLAGVINRMERFPRPALGAASDEEVIYAAEEVRAATVAWFAALDCPVLNIPTPYSPMGLSAYESTWRHHADRLGVRTASLTMSVDQDTIQQTDLTIVVIGETVLAAEDNPVPVSVLETCLNLTHATGFKLLGIEFCRSLSGDWELLRVDMKPNLMDFGPQVIDAILAVMDCR